MTQRRTLLQTLLPMVMVVQLAGCATLQSAYELIAYDLLPAPGSTHLADEPLACGMLDDPVHSVPDDAPIWGVADFHLHQFSNLGFGGRLLWGQPFHEEGIEHALSACGVNELCLDDRESFACREAVCRFSDDREACERGCRTHTCEETAPHGRGGLTDPVGMALGQGNGHRVTGHPDYAGWPHWNTYTHQQVYHRWLRRAFDGGLKLMVMMAVTNEVLCRLWEHEHACDDMANVDLQLDAAMELEKYIDYQNDCEVNGNGWYRIARSPEHARSIIRDGAMAVVLGLEVDTLFNCYEHEPAKHVHQRVRCTPEYVSQQIEKYHARGVRHVFPVHAFDNAFAGAAAYRDLLNFGNAFVNERQFDVRDCSADYDFRFGKISSSVQRFLSSAARTLGFELGDYDAPGAHCNEKGLTDLGTETIQMLMDHHIIIDVDHMSAQTRSDVLALAEARRYPGLVSGHAGFTALYRGQKKSEGQLTPAEVERLVKLGGLLAPILAQAGRDDFVPYEGAGLAHDCGNSAQTFAHAYLYAVDQTAAHGDPTLQAVGIGSDLNGLAGMPTPRFGASACGGDGLAQPDATRVEYPIHTYRDLGGVMDRPRVGSRELDINTDGYAHVGMFPDFVAELQAIGLSDAQLAPLFRSAEAYIELWERAERN